MLRYIAKKIKVLNCVGISWISFFGTQTESFAELENTYKRELKM